MSMHNEIMNIPTISAPPTDGVARNAYKLGHRDARHEAAEIACRGDAEIERLTALNSALTENGNSYVIENARQAEEIERLKTVPMKYRRMAFNAQLQEENTQLSEKIERLTADLAESRRKSADLEISLQASRDMALRAYGADVCPNCDTALPKGCEGVFANDHDCMWRKT